MNHKQLAAIAIFIVAVFLVIIVAYPLMFNPVENAGPKGEPDPTLEVHE
jgi:hypothetical protein